MLDKPTPERIRHYGRRFEEGGYDVTERAVGKLFATFPKNTMLDEVLLKAASVNTLDNTNIYAIYNVAEHIWRLGIDREIEHGSLALVERIAVVTLKGKPRRNYSFASKYCHFQAPEIYSIYDSYVEQLLWDYQRKDHFGDFRRGDMQNYPRYRSIVDRFREVYQLSGFSVKELDRFLWLYGIERSNQGAEDTG